MLTDESVFSSVYGYSNNVPVGESLVAVIYFKVSLDS